MVFWWLTSLIVSNVVGGWVYVVGSPGLWHCSYGVQKLMFGEKMFVAISLESHSFRICFIEHRDTLSQAYHSSFSFISFTKSGSRSPCLGYISSPSPMLEQTVVTSFSFLEFCHLQSCRPWLSRNHKQHMIRISFSLRFSFSRLNASLLDGSNSFNHHSFFAFLVLFFLFFAGWFPFEHNGYIIYQGLWRDKDSSCLWRCWMSGTCGVFGRKGIWIFKIRLVFSSSQGDFQLLASLWYSLLVLPGVCFDGYE